MTTTVGRSAGELTPPIDDVWVLPGMEELRSQLVSGATARSATTALRWDPALRPSAETIDRFHAKVVKTPTCWWWTGAISKPDGYGRISYQVGDRARTLSAQRFAMLASGVQLTGDVVCEHACNETICVRLDPRHVHAGTQTANLRYAVATGRHRGPLPGDIDPRGRYGRAIAIRAALVGGYDEDRLAAALAWPTAGAIETLALFEPDCTPQLAG